MVCIKRSFENSYCSLFSEDHGTVTDAGFIYFNNLAWK